MVEEPSEKTYSLTLYSVSPDPDHPLLVSVEPAIEKLYETEMEDYSFTSDRFDELRKEGRESPAPPTDEELRAVDVLKDKDARKLAIAIKTAGGLLVRDVPKQVAPSAKDRSRDLQALIGTAGLVRTEVVVVCKQTQAQIARLPEAGMLEELASQGVQCACGKPISEEGVEEALSISSLGQTLLDGSRWMSILAFQELRRLGVAPERILLEQEIEGDELDCLANVSGELVFVELKDKEFSLGNAYSFGSKMGIVRPEHPVIVTTEHVGGDAKQHFERAEQARRPRRYRSYQSAEQDQMRAIRYIEGLDAMRSGLEDICSEIYRRDAARVLGEVLPMATPDTGTILQAISSRNHGDDGRVARSRKSASPKAPSSKAATSGAGKARGARKVQVARRSK